MKEWLRKYTMGFDPFGLCLFAVIMLPNFWWMAHPAPNDVLRVESATPVVDMMGSICQVAMVFGLCFIRRVDAKPLRITPLMVAALVCVLVYLADRQNIIGLIPAVLFILCHVIFAIVNFLMMS